MNACSRTWQMRFVISRGGSNSMQGWVVAHPSKLIFFFLPGIWVSIDADLWISCCLPLQPTKSILIHQAISPILIINTSAQILIINSKAQFKEKERKLLDVWTHNSPSSLIQKKEAELRRNNKNWRRFKKTGGDEVANPYLASRTLRPSLSTGTGEPFGLRWFRAQPHRRTLHWFKKRGI